MSSHVQKQYSCSKVNANHIDYEWLIKDFKLFPQENTKCVDSPVFHAKENDQVKWKLQLFPNGSTEDFEGYVSLFVRVVSQDTQKKEIRVDCQLSILKSKNMLCSESFIQTYNKEYSWGYPKIIERSKLLKSCSSDDSFTIRCKVAFSQRIITEPVKPSVDSISFDLQTGQLNEHFTQLFEDSRLSDVTILVGNEKFFAHKLLLSVRSTVFAAMFEHKEMSENCKNEVKIDDMEPAIVKAMLEFIYTDKVSDLEIQARKLLKVSDKYDLHRLRVMCEEILYKTLTSDNAAEILVLADLNHSQKLKEYVMRFIEDDPLSVIKSESYDRLVEGYPGLAKELIYSIISRRGTKA
ncbi:speckle-type POZ protein B-like [Diachasma alloeum]|uniref:speckle-type POZ protein B-like n=1 Tax=Diachasma alloeum TaxID=454923 RepID=UPI0010FB2B5C|nr:speckle-type POZ protein B-like [Diachasma alloeum]